MPKFPEFSDRPNKIPASVFEKYAAKIAAKGDDLIRLHIGDTYLPIEYDLPIYADFLKSNPDYNRYCNTFGVPALREVLAQKLREDNDLPVETKNVLITNGATNALSTSMMALVNPGESILVLSPTWPFFFGMVKVAGGEVIDVPLYMDLIENPELNVLERLSNYLSETTVGIYLNTPNNPTGKVLSKTQIEQVANFAKEYNLWVVSDEAYDGLTFDGHNHISIASLPDMFERTITAFTFSKSFMFAGVRIGYAVGEASVIAALNKMLVHQIYSPSTSQEMLVAPVKSRKKWQPQIREHYQDLRDLALEKFQLKIPAPESGYFAFFSIEEILGGRDYWRLIDDCLETGVAVAPGDSFGTGYDRYLRFCFTGEPKERLSLGIGRLNRILFE